MITEMPLSLRHLARAAPTDPPKLPPASPPSRTGWWRRWVLPVGLLVLFALL
ncbi:hypothetical protein AB0J83_23860 [Actinoplanes sp. NPDC049596]|uniref:hypothetical protein n=1 Tax=unclassified Actinoplanes TaxID=2626549 RepID=UPI0034308B35